MFETAFLLAVDLGHHDLFMDLHYIAVKIGQTEMAAAARAQASALLSRCSSEGNLFKFLFIFDRFKNYKSNIFTSIFHVFLERNSFFHVGKGLFK